MANEQEAGFRLRLHDEISGAADTARGALDDLREQMDADTKSLATLNKAMKNLQSGTVVNVQQFKALKEAIDSQKKAISSAQEKYFNLGGSVESLSKKLPGAKNGMQAFLAQAQRAGGPLGAMAAGLLRVQAFIGANKMRAALLGIAAGVTALTLVTARAVKQLYEYATAQANARRSETLRLEGLSKVRSYMTVAYRIGETSAKDLQGSLDRVTSKVPLAREQVAQFQDQLYRAGLRGKQLDSALEGMAIKASAQGNEQAQLFAQWAQIYNLSGRSVDTLTNKVKDRLGGVVKGQMLDANVQATKLQESYAALFNELKIDGLLKAQATFNAIFSQSTASGRTLSRLLTSMQQTLVDGATLWRRALTFALEAGILGVLKLESLVLHARLGWLLLGESIRTALKRVVLGVRDMRDVMVGAIRDVRDALAGQLDKPFRDMEAGAQVAIAAVSTLAVRLTLSLVPAVTQFARTLVTTTLPAVLQFTRTLVMTTLPALARMAWALVLQSGPALITWGRTLVTTAIPAVRAFGLSTWTAARGVLAMTWPVLLAIAAMWGLYKIGELIYVVWKEIDWADLGMSIMRGIGNGVQSMSDWLWDKIDGAAALVKDAFKSALGINSPSTVFAELGKSIPEGLVIGIKSGKSNVAGAVNGLVTPGIGNAGGAGGVGSAAAASVAGAAAGGGGNSVTVTIQEVHINGGASAADGKSAATAFKIELERILQGVAFELGAGEGAT